MSLARNVATVGTATLLSRVLGFARDMAIAAMFGATPFSEAFFAVLQVINFFRRLLVEGALNSAFVPIWLRLKSGEDGQAQADRFTQRILLAMLCITGIITLAVKLFARPLIAAIAPGFEEGRRELATLLLAIASPYIFFAGLVAVIAAALNAEGRVAAVTISTVMFNVVMLAVVALVFDDGLNSLDRSILLAGAIFLAALVQFLITGITWLATGKRWRRANLRIPAQMRVFFVRAVPGLIAAGVPQLKLIAAAAIVSSSGSAVAWLYYANRLYELPLGVASIAIAAVIVPRIAASLLAGDAEDFAASQSRAFEIALGLALPAATGFALLAEPIAGGLFQRGAFTPADTAAVAAALMAICAGLPGHVLEKVLGAVSFAHEDTHTPMLAAFCGLAAAIAGGLLLFPRYGYVGAAAAIAISGWVGAAVLGSILYQRQWLRLDPSAVRRLPRIVLATVIMGAVVMSGLVTGHTLFPTLPHSQVGRLFLLAVLVALGLAVYAVTLQILGVAKLKDLAAAVRRRA